MSSQRRREYRCLAYGQAGDLLEWAATNPKALTLLASFPGGFIAANQAEVAVELTRIAGEMRRREDRAYDRMGEGGRSTTPP